MLKPDDPTKSADCSTHGKPLMVRPPKFQSIKRGAFMSTTTNHMILKGIPQSKSCLRKIKGNTSDIQSSKPTSKPYPKKVTAEAPSQGRCPKTCAL